jgi:hypothetical protein
MAHTAVRLRDMWNFSINHELINYTKMLLWNF